MKSEVLEGHVLNLESHVLASSQALASYVQKSCQALGSHVLVAL